MPPAWADEQLLEEVIRNLLENAARYSPSSEPIGLGARLVDGVLEVSVTDHGPGVPADEQARIFESFHRIGEVETTVAGYGLGLYFVDRLIRAQHGTVGVESPVGRDGGARRTLLVPDSRSRVRRRTRTTTSRGRSRPTQAAGACLMARIMLVDDDRSLLELLGDYLGRLGHDRHRHG